MARTIDIGDLPSGVSLTAEVFALGGNTLVETITLTERTVAKCSYTGTIVTASGAEYRLAIKQGSSYIGATTAIIGATDGVTYYARDGANVVEMLADTITSSALAASAVTEVQSGLATSAALATVQSDTDDIQTRLPAALVSGRMDTSVGAMAANTVTAAALATDAVTEIQSGLATPTNITAATGIVLSGVTHTGAVIPTVSAVTGLTASNLDATVSSRASQLSLDTLDDYVDTEIAAIKAKTDQLVFTVANQVDANALSGGGSGLDAAQTRAALGLASANLDTQLGDLPTTAELSTALETADDATLAAIAALNNLSAAQVTAAVPTVAAIQSGLATIANQTTINNNVLAVPAAITSDHGAGSYIRNTEPETGLATAANLALVKVDTAAILLDTDSLDTTKLTTARAAALDLITAARMGALTDWIDGGRLDLILDIIAADTTTDIPALIAALPSAASIFTAVLTTALTESYAADGTPPTLAQAIMLIQQTLTEFAISGATTTVKKLDGITTAATLTLNSATTPTAVTRAT